MRPRASAQILGGCLSHPAGTPDSSQWQELKSATPVRVQWDPERDLSLRPLPYRAIQIGLSKEAVQLYIGSWIQRMVEVTDVAHRLHNL